MMNIIPQSDYILLTEVDDKKETESGIYLPESADIERTLPGTVVSKGKGVTLEIEKGNLVLFKRHLFDEIVYNDTKYLFGKEANILAILKHD